MRNGKPVRVKRKIATKRGANAQPKCEAKIKTYGNIWTRELKYNKAGEMKKGHKHEFDHLHFLARGSVKVSVYSKDDKTKPILVKEYQAPVWIKVPKEHYHDIVALEDNSLGYCIQAIRNENDEVVDSNYAYDEDFMEEVRRFEAENGQPDETLK